ncbi:cytochrome c oxidase assembly protein [Idiomarina tyrosinivorans]|uniref:Cytochrome c oxidase assembly protein CtaG n=1 Tax=Idiomarina tyrosinivorans TaxID=1445662 RepID=A0A432ZT91_9GAMM|nr:cytochrome c oxidase assembly protein [Idiomarina tyrosinivorans]RUO81155.1 cytochrome c oxidase assembly protein [Idiomarina tyrosinivorans]
MAQQSNNRKIIFRLLLGVAGMFAFGFALVPLYNAFCDATGFNGRTKNEAVAYTASHVDKSRTVTVQFLTHNAKGMPWQFKPDIKEVHVHPGEVKLVTFYAANPTARRMVAQAVPSIAPAEASLYLNKIECFCFNQQPLAANTDAEMPVQFYLDPEIPEHITTLTLSYTLYDMTADANATTVAQTTTSE